MNGSELTRTKRKYVAGACVLAGWFGFAAIVSHRESANEERRREDQARILAEQAEQRRLEAERLAAPRANAIPSSGLPTMLDGVSPGVRERQLAYVAKLDVEVQYLERRIDGLQSQARSATADFKTDYDRLLNDVSARRDTLRTDVASIGTATDANWEQVQTRIDLDLQDLERSVRVASWRIGSGSRRAPL